MIKSEKQLVAAKEQLKVLQDGTTTYIKPALPKILSQAAMGQKDELCNEIDKEIKEYELLRNNTNHKIEIHSLQDLRLAPIRYRIAANLSIVGFAKLVNIHSRQIARYESEEYQNVTCDNLFKILACLNVKIDGKVEVTKMAA